VILFNLGMLHDMTKDDESARRYFEQALQRSREIGMDEGVKESKGALKRLQTSNPRRRYSD